MGAVPAACGVPKGRQTEARPLHEESRRDGGISLWVSTANPGNRAVEIRFSPGGATDTAPPRWGCALCSVSLPRTLVLGYVPPPRWGCENSLLGYFGSVQTSTELSVLPTRIFRLSGVNATANTFGFFAGYFRSCLPLAISQRRTSPSRLADRMRLPSGEYAIRVTKSLWPLNSLSSLPASTSQSSTVPSSIANGFPLRPRKAPPEMARLPSGENARQTTCPVSPKLRISLPVSGSHKRIV